MKRLLVLLVAFILLPVGSTLLVRVVAAQVVCAGGKPTYTFAGVSYCFPTSQGAAGTALVNNGSGVLSWAPATPPDVVTFSTDGTCPTGWSEYTAGRGRALVGLVSGGTSAAAVGTALTNSEDRPVGQHTHAVTDPGHSHTQDAHAHGVSDPGHAHVIGSYPSSNIRRDLVGDLALLIAAANSAIDTAVPGLSLASETAVNQGAATGLTVDTTGSVLGTNAPYVQLVMCRSASGS